MGKLNGKRCQTLEKRVTHGVQLQYGICAEFILVAGRCCRDMQEGLSV